MSLYHKIFEARDPNEQTRISDRLKPFRSSTPYGLSSNPDLRSSSNPDVRSQNLASTQTKKNQRNIATASTKTPQRGGLFAISASGNSSDSGEYDPQSIVSDRVPSQNPKIAATTDRINRLKDAAKTRTGILGKVKQWINPQKFNTDTARLDTLQQRAEIRRGKLQTIDKPVDDIQSSRFKAQGLGAYDIARAALKSKSKALKAGKDMLSKHLGDKANKYHQLGNDSKDAIY